ncbi:Lrp/AsnC family transcriptional regulator [Azospirillum sp. YIM DDC1]|uniref:siroheme decarboxylase n=1 Tax=Azospirillum aestuarii TaxID=2802052 RepID=A0ABS1I7F6_9PROT|nr:Lrp/AsnC family transcriptional regulator [Azospirillum aestuarii]MBK4722983.1 Lrp/AsnC family transcriptional regulator [Azospirillum aestuarii]
MTAAVPVALDDSDRRLILATQGGLPAGAMPFDAVADQLGLPVDEVLERFRRLLEAGIVRRIAAVPNHYRLGYTANGMSVWEVPEDAVNDAGRRFAGLPWVSHCYRRPARPPAWPFTLFAMVHAKTRDEVEARVADMAVLLGDQCRSHTVLYSTRILKKTGFRLTA